MHSILHRLVALKPAEKQRSGYLLKAWAPLSSVVVVAVAIVPTLLIARGGRDQGCPMNSTGLTLTDGRTLPTYDWIASPIESSLHSPRGARTPTP